MNVIKQEFDDEDTLEGTPIPPNIGFTPDVLPEVQQPMQAENSQTGVSTRNALLGTDPPASIKKRKASHWYALRATYGQAKKAYDYLVEQGMEAYHPTIKAFKMVNGKRIKVEESRMLNILFARGREEDIKAFVYDNANLPYLRFYYRRYTVDREICKEPLIVPDSQMANFMIVCADQTGGNVLVPPDEHKFDNGDTVRVIGGQFKGVVGRVARYCGQQRVAVIIDGLLTIATTYIPNAYLEKLE